MPRYTATEYYQDVNPVYHAYLQDHRLVDGKREAIGFKPLADTLHDLRVRMQNEMTNLFGAVLRFTKRDFDQRMADVKIEELPETKELIEAIKAHTVSRIAILACRAEESGESADALRPGMALIDHAASTSSKVNEACGRLEKKLMAL